MFGRLGPGLGLGGSVGIKPALNLLIIGDSLANRIQTKGGDELDAALAPYFSTINRNNVAISGTRSFKYLDDLYGGGYIYDTVGDEFSTAYTDLETSNSVTPADYDTGVIWLGTNDALADEVAGFDRADYKAKLEELIAAVKARYVNMDQIILMPLNRKTTSPAFADVQFQDIRAIEKEIAVADSAITLGPVVYDTDMADASHPTDAEFQSTVSPRVGRYIAAARGRRGFLGILGPIINAASYDGFEITASITHDGGNDITVPSGSENFFMYENTNEYRPVPSKTGANTITLDLGDTGARIDGTPVLYAGYGQLDALSDTSPEVPYDNTGLPLRYSTPTLTNNDVISQLTDLHSVLRPYVGEKTYSSGVSLSTISDMNGGSWSGGSGHEPEYDATAFEGRGGIVANNADSSLRINDAFTGSQARMIGLVVEFPESAAGNTYVAALGNGATGRFDAGLVLNTGGQINWFYDETGAGAQSIATGVFGQRAIILLDIKSDGMMDIYYNSATPVASFDPDNQAFTQTYLWLLAQSHTADSEAGLAIGEAFVKESAHNGGDPSIADIISYWNSQYDVGLV